MTPFMDNQYAVHLIRNPVLHKRCKHVDLRFHFNRERYEAKEFELEFIPTKEQLPDILTKPLTRTVFQYCTYETF